MEKIVVTIDVDFFTREDIWWDFGHSEDNEIFMTDLVWQTRYQSIDLFKETSLGYADCAPYTLLPHLKSLGFKINSRTKTGAGWSHKHAYDMFEYMEFSRLINFDAHHDCYLNSDKVLSERIDCGNWLLHLIRKKRYPIKAQWIVPKWADGDESEQVQRFSYGQLASLAGKVVGIYVCQSPAWVSPHHDNIFFDLVGQLKTMTGRKYIDFDRSYASRKLASLSCEEATKMFEQRQQALKELVEFEKKLYIKTKEKEREKDGNNRQEVNE